LQHNLKFNMNKLTGKSAKCKDCKGLGYIKTTAGCYTECIICNSSGTTLHGPNGITKEAEQVLLFKIALDYINGKQKGWYH